MAQVPLTSVTLLKAIADDATSARWTEFHNAYVPLMRGYLHEHFPSLEADDIIQEALIALVRRLPNYHYTPDEKGHFRNYLIGIVHNKAIDALERDKRERDARKGSRHEQTIRASERPTKDDAWREVVFNVAVDQLMADTSISPRTRAVFQHVALLHEPPDAVAAQFGITRNNVDQIKSRLIDHLAELVAAMSADL